MNGLEDNFLVDLEYGTDSLESYVGVNVKAEAQKRGTTNSMGYLRILKETADALKTLKPKRITIDTISELEE